MPWGGLKGWASRKSCSPCCGLLSLEEGGREMWGFFLTLSASVLKMCVIKVMNGKMTERAANKLLPAPLPPEMGQPSFPAACHCASSCITVEGAALGRAPESQGPGPRGWVSNYGYQSCLEVGADAEPRSRKPLHMQVTAERGQGWSWRIFQNWFPPLNTGRRWDWASFWVPGN